MSEGIILELIIRIVYQPIYNLMNIYIVSSFIGRVATPRVSTNIGSGVMSGS